MFSSTSNDHINDVVADSSDLTPLEHPPSVEDRTCGTAKSKEVSSITNDDDDFTISGYGEISLSEDCYIPSLPAPCSPIKDESFRRPRRPNGKKEHALLSRPRAPALKSKIFVSDGQFSEATIARISRTSHMSFEEVVRRASKGGNTSHGSHLRALASRAKSPPSHNDSEPLSKTVDNGH